MKNVDIDFQLLKSFVPCKVYFIASSILLYRVFSVYVSYLHIQSDMFYDPNLLL